MLTLDKLKEMEPGTVFATGIISNSPEGVYMTDERYGDKLRWVAKRGGIHDWAIYIGWEEKSLEYVKDYGDKVYNEFNIKKLVPCTDEAYKQYRL